MGIFDAVFGTLWTSGAAFHRTLACLVSVGRSITEPEATVLLCDAAESVNGKLYILGAGWSQFQADQPVNMVLAIKLLIPWNRANETITVRVSLADEDREETVVLDPGAVEGEAKLEMGRPPRSEAGNAS